LFCGLNPALKLGWFDEKWGTTHLAWVKEVEQVIDTLYLKYQREYPDKVLAVGAVGQGRELSAFAWYNTLSNYSALSELQRYIREPVLEGTSSDNVIHWWRDNRSRYPLLSRIALDLLSSPATTAADERLFSAANDVINDERARLSEDTAEAIQCLRSWINSGLVDLTMIDFSGNDGSSDNSGIDLTLDLPH